MELLFGHQRSRDIQLPGDANIRTMGALLPWIRDLLLQERPELFMQDNTVYGAL